jgi:hypothetical protein
LGHQGLVSHRGIRNGHDLGRKDQVGADSAFDPGLFQFFGRDYLHRSAWAFLGIVMLAKHGMDFFIALKT